MISADQDTVSPGVANPFRVIETGTVRKDLESRREVKFVLPGMDVGRLRSLLDCQLRSQVHNEKISTVRSVYFDDPGFSSCHANLDGVGRRRKVRVRWYDSLAPGKSFFFEIKWRNNRITGKHRWEIASDVPLVDVPLRAAREHLQTLIPEEFQAQAYRYSEPIMLVEYKREHYVSMDKMFRFTIDYDLKFYDLFGRQNFSFSFPTVYEDFVVLEAKFPPGKDAGLCSLLYPFAPRVGSSSKYVQGCRLLGLVRETD
jgi:hypothetical protein